MCETLRARASGRRWPAAFGHLFEQGRFLSYVYVPAKENESWSRDRGAAFAELAAARGVAVTPIRPDFEKEGFLAAQTLDALMSPRSRKPTTSNQQPTTLYVGVRQVVRRDSTFAEESSTSIRAAIEERRLQQVRHLLKTTRLSTDEIATRCGYGNPNVLRNLFKHTFSMSMRDFRLAFRTTAVRISPDQRQSPGHRNQGLR